VTNVIAVYDGDQASGSIAVLALDNIIMSFIKYFIAWFPMLLIAIANGAARDLIYKKYVGDLTAHQISTFSLILLFAMYTWYIVSKYPPASGIDAMFVGILWVVLTLAFEFGFGRARGNSWEKLLEDYNLLKGRLWVLIPIWVAIAPYIFYRLAKYGQ
jgi:hypothetical protein